MRLIFSAFAILALCFLLACTSQQRSPEEVRKQAANATAAAKQDAVAIAQGVREGWNRDKALNLNTASKEQLSSLPGMNGAKADRIIAGRPYRHPEDLVERRIVSQHEYDRIASRVTAH